MKALQRLLYLLQAIPVAVSGKLSLLVENSSTFCGWGEMEGLHTCFFHCTRTGGLAFPDTVKYFQAVCLIKVGDFFFFFFVQAFRSEMMDINKVGHYPTPPHLLPWLWKKAATSTKIHPLVGASINVLSKNNGHSFLDLHGWPQIIGSLDFPPGMELGNFWSLGSTNQCRLNPQKQSLGPSVWATSFDIQVPMWQCRWNIFCPPSPESMLLTLPHLRIYV